MGITMGKKSKKVQYLALTCQIWKHCGMTLRMFSHRAALASGGCSICQHFYSALKIFLDFCQLSLKNALYCTFFYSSGPTVQGPSQKDQICWIPCKLCPAAPNMAREQTISKVNHTWILGGQFLQILLLSNHGQIVISARIINIK